MSAADLLREWRRARDAVAYAARPEVLTALHVEADGTGLAEYLAEREAWELAQDAERRAFDRLAQAIRPDLAPQAYALVDLRLVEQYRDIDADEIPHIQHTPEWRLSVGMQP